MQTFAIIPNLNVLEDDRVGQGMGCKLPSDTFELEDTEETLHNSIVIAVANAAHADLAFQNREALLKGDAGVLTTLVRMEQ